MSKYHFNDIEEKWQRYWSENQTFKADNKSDKPKYYVLDMFPYPSGAGLHVGHPLGYIASDVYARYKRHKGFNVLHPMGYDSFGLPAEQYAIQTGQHPAETTKVNIEGGVDNTGREIPGYRKQLDRIGFSFDWSREVRTSDPDYYKWTQWIFIRLFESWYDISSDKARPVSELIAIFEEKGNTDLEAACDPDVTTFTAEEWKSFSEEEKQKVLLKYRLTYLAETEVNWCPELGTVLANDEVVNGVSERGGYPVIRKRMKQWSMRITAYAQRLLDGLDKIDWPQPLKDSQTNWIGRSEGALVSFKIKDHSDTIKVFTTRPDTIFGVSYMALAPEHELVSKITTETQSEAVNDYVEATSRRSERERMADVKSITGVFSGAFALHPFTGEEIPIWIGDYVLAGYGTGAVMAVPGGDRRDYDFAGHFGLPIPNIFEGIDISEEPFMDKDNTRLKNSDFLNGLDYKQATKKVIAELEKQGAGEGKINYRLRDAVFSRQRYWGEPFPVYYKDGLPQMIADEHLPLELPEVEKYLPTEEGEPPLGRAEVWAWDTEQSKVVDKAQIDHKTVFPLELNTMPGWAGSSCYLFRYMDPHNDEMLASEAALNYWKNVDLYIGGSEHATGHLLYSRFWTKFLFDRGVLPVDEPFRKLINQGMILGESALIYRISARIIDVTVDYSLDAIKEISQTSNVFASFEFLMKLSNNKIKVNNSDVGHFFDAEDNELSKIVVDALNMDNKYDKELRSHKYLLRINYDPIRIDVNNVDQGNKIIDLEKLKIWDDLKNGKFINDNGAIDKSGLNFTVGREVEKMSKRWLNVVNPDDICERYGADTLRMYEMFLGPLDQAKPWNMAGITGVHSFLKKLWKLYHRGENDSFHLTDDKASSDSLKTLHKTIKKVEEDIENFSFNTSVSTFMIAVNELTALKCTQRSVLEPLIILISPYAPHIAEELWSKLGHEESIATAAYPKFEASYLVENSKEYPVSFNGKMRFKLELPLDLSKDEIESAVMAHEKTAHYLEGRTPKKVIVVPGKIINIVG